MASNLDFSGGIAAPPVLDKIQRRERINDNLPRRRFQIQEKPNKRSSDDDASPEDIKTSDEDGTEKRRLDLRV